MSELAEISANLEIALNHCSIPAYVLDTSGVVLWLNEAAIRIVRGTALSITSNNRYFLTYVGSTTSTRTTIAGRFGTFS